jgi:hypothetical protein
MDQPEAPAYHPGIPEDPFNPGGAGLADNIKILRPFPEHQIPDGAAYYIGLKAFGAQPLGDMHRIAVNISDIDPMFVLRINNRFFNGFAVFFRPVSDKQRSLFTS